MRLVLIVLSASILIASVAYSETTTTYRYDTNQVCTTICNGEGNLRNCSEFCY